MSHVSFVNRSKRESSKHGFVGTVYFENTHTLVGVRLIVSVSATFGLATQKQMYTKRSNLVKIFPRARVLWRCILVKRSKVKIMRLHQVQSHNG